MDFRTKLGKDQTRPASDERLWTTKETARYVGKGESSLEQDRYLGRGIPYIKLGKTVRYRPSDVRNYIEQNAVGITV